MTLHLPVWGIFHGQCLCLVCAGHRKVKFGPKHAICTFSPLRQGRGCRGMCWAWSETADCHHNVYIWLHQAARQGQEKGMHWQGLKGQGGL